MIQVDTVLAVIGEIMPKRPESRQTGNPRRKRTPRNPPPTQPHDSGYKLLFSHPAMVADLLTGFVAEDWVRELDFSTLEKQSGSYVSDDLRPRADDVVWRAGGNAGCISTCCWNSSRKSTGSWRCGCWSMSGCCIRT